MIHRPVLVKNSFVVNTLVIRTAPILEQVSEHALAVAEADDNGQRDGYAGSTIGVVV